MKKTVEKMSAFIRYNHLRRSSMWPNLSIPILSCFVVLSSMTISPARNTAVTLGSSGGTQKLRYQVEFDIYSQANDEYDIKPSATIIGGHVVVSASLDIKVSAIVAVDGPEVSANRSIPVVESFVMSLNHQMKAAAKVQDDNCPVGKGIRNIEIESKITNPSRWSNPGDPFWENSNSFIFGQQLNNGRWQYVLDNVFDNAFERYLTLQNGTTVKESRSYSYTHTLKADKKCSADTPINAVTSESGASYSNILYTAPWSSSSDYLGDDYLNFTQDYTWTADLFDYFDNSVRWSGLLPDYPLIFKQVSKEVVLKSTARVIQTPNPTNGVNLELRTFIPCEAIMLVALGDERWAFAGDGYSGNTYRSLQQINATAPPESPLVISGPSLSWGTSKRYLPSQVITLTNKPSWCRDFLPNQKEKPNYIDTLTVDPSNNSVYVQVSPEQKLTQVKFFVDGGNPAAPLPDFLVPNLSADISVFIRRLDDGTLQYRASGSHDRFPAYYLYLNGVTIHCYDPLLMGGSPWSLTPVAEDELVDTGTWRSVTSPDICTHRRGVRVNYPATKPNSFLTLTGVGFEANSRVVIALNNVPIANVGIDASGTLKAALDTSNADVGYYSVQVRSATMSTNRLQNAGSELAKTSFIVDLRAPYFEKDDDVQTVYTVPSDIARTYIFMPLSMR